MDGMGDLALLRLSDGRLYFSKLHYCCGITDTMPYSDTEQLPQPADAADFLTGVGRCQQWILLSSDYRLRCTVVCPDADRPIKNKKSLWISISDSDAGNETSLFERRYTFSGSFIAWSTRWDSNENVTVDVFDCIRNPMMQSVNESDMPTNHLATLEFHRDKQTGRFTDGQQ